MNTLLILLQKSLGAGGPIPTSLFLLLVYGLLAYVAFWIFAFIFWTVIAISQWVWHRGFLDDWDEWSDTHRQSFAVFYFCHRKFVMPKIEKDKRKQKDRSDPPICGPF